MWYRNKLASRLLIQSLEVCSNRNQGGRGLPETGGEGGEGRREGRGRGRGGRGKNIGTSKAMMLHESTDLGMILEFHSQYLNHVSILLLFDLKTIGQYQ